MNSMSPDHHRRAAALRRLYANPFDAGLATTIPVLMTRPHLTEAKHGGHALPKRAMYSTRTEAPRYRYSRRCEAALARLDRRRARRGAREKQARTALAGAGLVLTMAGTTALLMWVTGILVRIFWTP